MHAVDGSATGPGRGPEVAGDDVWELVERAKENDREAFGQLYDRYLPTVFRYLQWRCGDRTLAEDLTADTFVRALRGIRSLKHQGKDPGSWFITIARNLLLDHVKSARSRVEVITGDMGSADRATDGPEDQVLGRLTAAEALRYVRQLAPDQQECVVLRIFEGLSVSETAERMGRSEGAVKALTHRAMRRLAECMPRERYT